MIGMGVVLNMLRNWGPAVQNFKQKDKVEREREEGRTYYASEFSFMHACVLVQKGFPQTMT